MEFDPRAEYAGCRLCGQVYQTELDRRVIALIELGYLELRHNPLLDEDFIYGDEEYVAIYNEASERRQRWRALHRKRYHSDREVEAFSKTGFALTPEAAHKLAPFGFAPMGNMHRDIVNAMETAPRAPVDDAEGG